MLEGIRHRPVARSAGGRASDMGERGSHGFPAPAVIVLARNRFAVARHAGHAVIAVAAVFTRLVARPLVTERMAASCRLRRRGRCGGRCRPGRRGRRNWLCRAGGLDWRGRCGWRRRGRGRHRRRRSLAGCRSRLGHGHPRDQGARSGRRRGRRRRGTCRRRDADDEHESAARQEPGEHLVPGRPGLPALRAVSLRWLLAVILAIRHSVSPLSSSVRERVVRSP
jgi:hypothetical protein